MGDRAFYVVTSNGKHEIFYSHWGSQHICRDFFFGPDVAIDLIRSAAPMDTVFPLAQGGAIIDLDRKVLRAWSNDNIDHEIGLREMWLEMLRLSWPGWDTDWCIERATALAKHLGFPLKEYYIEPNQPDFIEKALQIKPKTAPGCTFFTVRCCDGRLHDFLAQYYYYLLVGKGPAIIPEIESQAASPLRTELDSHYHQYVFIDVAASKVWAAPIAPEGYLIQNLKRKIESVWPGWEWHLHDEGLAFHVRLSGRDPGPLLIPAKDLLERLRSIIMSGDFDPKHLLELGTQGLPTNGTIQINPGFLQRHALRVSKQERERHFERIIALWMDRHCSGDSHA
jgi:hypothetical protein